MARKYFYAIATIALLSTAGCASRANNTQPTATPSATAPSTSASPTVKPSATTTPTINPCPESSWDTGPQVPKIEQLTSNPILKSSVTWEKCFDRFTVVLKGGNLLPHYRAEYVDLVKADGSGFPVPVAGKAFLQFIVSSSMASSDAIDTSVGKMIQQARSAGWFEGQMTFAIGVDAKRPFAVRVLPGTGNTTRVMVSFAR